MTKNEIIERLQAIDDAGLGCHLIDDLMIDLKKSTLTSERPLTASVLAEAFESVWNAAMGEAHRQQSHMPVAAIIAESFAEMARQLREKSG